MRRRNEGNEKGQEQERERLQEQEKESLKTHFSMVTKFSSKISKPFGPTPI